MMCSEGCWSACTCASFAVLIAAVSSATGTSSLTIEHNEDQRQHDSISFPATGVSASSAATAASLSGSTQVFIGSIVASGSFTTYALRATAIHGERRYSLVQEQMAQPAVARSWQGLHPTLPIVYTVDKLPPNNTGAVSAFKFDTVSGVLSKLGDPVEVGDDPVCVVAIGKDAIASAVYNAGGLATVLLNSNGMFNGEARFTNHTGKSTCTTPVGKARQMSPHPHGVFIHPYREDLLFSPDLGLDRIYQYRFDSEEGLIPLKAPFVTTLPCSGPRHMAFTQSGLYAAVVFEMGNTVAIYRFDNATGSLSEKPVFGPTSTLPDTGGWKYCSAENYTASFCTKAAEVRIVALKGAKSAVYVSNRGQNSIKHFLLDESSGKLTPVGFVENLEWVRSFGVLQAVADTPALLIAAARGGYGDVAPEKAGKLVVYEIVEYDGSLTEVSSIPANAPVAVVAR